MQEFADYGYDQASTNRIVKNAGIGKGMLFYYFNSKLELYHDLADYALQVCVDEYISQIDVHEPDFIERMKKIGKVKMKYLMQHPSVTHFLGTLLVQPDVELPQRIEKRIHEVQKLGFAKLYDHIDISLFRNDIDQAKAFKLIQWAIDGYQQEIIQRLKGQRLSRLDMAPYWEDFYSYLEVLKISFYKEESK